jgi:polar amino acid transport system substrate-binding protein
VIVMAGPVLSPTTLGRGPRPFGRALTVALATSLLSVAAGCGVSYSEPVEVALPDPISPSTTAPVELEDCDDDDPTLPAVASYRPLEELPAPGDMPAGSHMAEIQQRGKLVVGTSIDTNLFASLDPASNQIVGFDVDMAKLVALAIFGGSWDTIDERLELRGITFGQRIPALTSGEVDLVAHTMTINCKRWQQVAFSGVYFNAGQNLLVSIDSEIGSLDDLTDQRVCVSAGGTAAAEMAAAGLENLVEVDNLTDCMVQFQRGQVDAIRSDDAILAGFVAQDPFSKVADLDPLSEEPYGLAMSQDHPELVQFVNAVLEQAKDSDDPETSWTAIYDDWLRSALGAPVASLDVESGSFPTGAPLGEYGRPLPR